MMSMTVNNKLFDTEKVFSIVQAALICTKYDTPHLTTEPEEGYTIDNFDPALINKLCSTLTKNITFLTLRAMNSGTSSLKDAGLTRDNLSKTLNYNSHDWSKIVKCCFQNAVLINHEDKKTEQNWQQFTQAIKEMIENDRKEKSTHKKELKSHPAFVNISYAFKRFITQLVVDKQILTAEIIHSMLLYGYKVCHHTKKNKMDYEGVSAMLSIVFYGGLDFSRVLEQKNLKDDITYFAHGLKVLFGTEIFSYPFSTTIYENIFALEQKYNAVLPAFNNMKIKGNNQGANDSDNTPEHSDEKVTKTNLKKRTSNSSE